MAMAWKRTSTISTSSPAVFGVFFLSFRSRIARLPESKLSCILGEQATLDTPVLVQLDRRDDDIAGMDADGDRRAVRLVALNAVDVNYPLLTVHLGDLSLPALVLSPNNTDLVVLANRQ